MTRIYVRLPPGMPTPDADDFADITEAEVAGTSWGPSAGVLCIDFSSPLTAAQVRRVAIRCQSLTPAEEDARVELDRLSAAAASVADDPSATQRDRDFAAMFALVTSLLTPGPVMTEAGDAAGN